MRGREAVRPASLVEFRLGNKNGHFKPRLKKGSQWTGKLQRACTEQVSFPFRNLSSLTFTAHCMKGKKRL